MRVRRGRGRCAGNDESCCGCQPNGALRASSRCEACDEAWRSAVSRSRDAEYTEYVAARLSSLRRRSAGSSPCCGAESVTPPGEAFTHLLPAFCCP
jgi:hypothetical protein